MLVTNESPQVIASDVLESDDGVLFDTPVITVDPNNQIEVQWPHPSKPAYVQMGEPLFTEWVEMMNALRRLNDLLLNVLAIEHRTHADGEPGRVPAAMLREIERLKEMLRIP